MIDNISRDKVRVSVNVLVVDGDKVLLLKRKKKGEGTWCSPGGHLEYGEFALEAAKRELLEETGINAKKIIFAHMLNDPDCDTFHYVTINFVVKEWDGEPKIMESDKFSEWKWFLMNDLPTPMFSHHEVLIRMLKDGRIFQDGTK